MSTGFQPCRRRGRLRPPAPAPDPRPHRRAPAGRARRRVEQRCRSSRWWTRWGAAGSATSASRPSRSAPSWAPSTGGRRPSTARSAPARRRCGRAGSGSRRRAAAASSCRPIEVYRVGDIHFVLDGHHRVSVARALGETSIEAHVREVTTTVGAGPELRMRDLDLKRHERLFHERVPLRARPARADRVHRRVALRAARRPRRGLGLPRQPRARDAALAPGDRAGLVPGGVRARAEACSTRRTSAGREPRRSATCAWRCCATCCSTRTTGRRTSSRGCSARCARRAPRTTPWCTRSSRR